MSRALDQSVRDFSEAKWPRRARLEGWKELASYFDRTVRTIQRWEREEQLPVHRHLHGSAATVFAYADELAGWQSLRGQSAACGDGPNLEQSASGAGRDAHALCVMSHHHWAQRSRDGLHKSIALARTALHRDPDCAQAHALLARAHVTRASYGFAPPDFDIRLARESATRALELDPTVVEAHQALAFVYLGFDWDWKRAWTAIEQALRLNPADPTTHQWLSLWYLALDRDAEAHATAGRAEALDPTSPILAAHCAWILHHTGRIDEALAKASSLVRTDPHFWRGYFNLALSLVAIGRYADAVQALEVAAALNESGTLLAILIRALADAGERDRAQALSKTLTVESYVSPYWLAYAAVGLDGIEAAMDHVAQSLVTREWFLLFLKHDPGFAPLRTHPGFSVACRGVGLP